MANADRLQATQDETKRALEGRITDLMAKVHAASDITRQIAEADAQLEVGRNDLDNLDGDDADALRSAIADTEAYREELLDALAKLAGEIRG